MFVAGNLTVENASGLKEEETSCYHLNTFFVNADREVIFITDAIFCVVNALFSAVAVFSNLLVMYALYKATTLHTTSKALLCSLALSDLGVGAIVQPLFVTYRWAQINGNLQDLCIAGVISHIEGSHFSAVSFLSITAISIDRLLALLLKVQYHSIVTVKRVLLLLSSIWIGSGLWAFTWKTNQKKYSLISIIEMPVCFTITLSAYLKIYICLRKQARRMGSHVSLPANKRRETNDRSLSRFRKSTTSMFYLFCAFVVSFLPYLCHKIAVTFLGWRTSTSVLFSFGLTLVYLNSSLNPLIYCWRITEIKQIILHVLCRKKSGKIVQKVRFLPT